MTDQLSLDVGQSDRSMVADIAVPSWLRGATGEQMRDRLHPAGGCRDTFHWWTTRYGLHWGDLPFVAQGKTSWAEVAQEVAA